jgi:hypothetical protein
MASPLCGESSDREMGERDAKVSELLHEAAETHRLTFRITDGADDDWRPGIRSGSSGCPSGPADGAATPPAIGADRAMGVAQPGRHSRCDGRPRAPGAAVTSSR